jgi:restriction system protein
MTIVRAIKQVLSAQPEGMSVDEIYEQILKRSLYTFPAAEPRSVVRSMLRRHCIGLDFASASPVKYFRLTGSNKYLLASEEGLRSEPPKEKPAAKFGDSLPEEVIESSHQGHLEVVGRDLRQKILDAPPSFFETLVLDLLSRMGYGAGDADRLKHTGGPRDGGVDGHIYEDKLGLEKIYIQTKRYKIGRLVSPGEIRDFLGSLNKVRKGIFITTSDFTKDSIKTAREHEKSVVLINGGMLCSLMIKHGVGVDVIKAYNVYRIDSDYFPTDN